jgi:hypothetical protein
VGSIIIGHGSNVYQDIVHYFSQTTISISYGDNYIHRE